jgi:type I restriction enzyme M protein
MSDQQVSMSDIAQQLDVTLSAVSNWRRRHPSFPLAERAGDQDMFLVREIVGWLDGRKISKNDLKPGELPGTTYGTRLRKVRGMGHAPGVVIGDALWQELVQFHGAEDIGVFADLVLGLLYLAQSGDRGWKEIVAAEGSRRFQLVELAALDHTPGLRDLHRALGSLIDDARGEVRLTGIIRLVERMRQSGQGPETFEYLLDHFAAVAGRRGADMHTPAAVVRLLVELVAPAPGNSVFDPCCGSGGFLLGAAKYIESHGGRDFDLSFTGHALSERVASLALMNLRLHHVPVDVRVRADAIFRNDGSPTSNKRFDVVLSNPPFDLKEPARSASVPDLRGRYGILPKTRTNFAWLQYVTSSLTDRGRAAVVMPGGTLFRQGTESQVRTNMIEDGVVEAIIGLPSQMFVSTGIPVTVWLLRPPGRQGRGEILLIDASDLGHLVSRTQRSLSDEDHGRIVSTVEQWRAGDGYEDVRGFSAAVGVQRIREQGYVLTPARYVGTNVELDTPRRSVRQLHDDLTWLEQRAAKADVAAKEQLDRIWPWIH